MEDFGSDRNYSRLWKSSPEQKDMFVANKEDEHDQTRLLDSLVTSFSSIYCIDTAKAREENSIKETHVRMRNRVEILGVVKAVGIAMIEAHGEWRGIDANSDIGGRTRHVTFLANRILEKLSKADSDEEAWSKRRQQRRLEDLVMSRERQHKANRKWSWTSLKVGQKA